MAFDQRHHDRVPITTPVSYEVLNRAGVRQGYGTVTNLSVRGWKINGNVPLQAGEVCSMEVRLPPKEWVSILVGVVRWSRGEEAGIETLVINDEAAKPLHEYIQARVKAL
ncbi:MAG: PilZ domain-containing protein [Nitrospira sp.]|nr:PilZ domain-containing protein [Nitrospira sp.]